jgi:predicted site-specific integrase-resolvase
MYAMHRTEDLRGSAELCERLGINRSTLSRWVKDGTATPAMRLPGKTGAFLFTEAEVIRLGEWYSEQTRAATA